MFEKLGPKDPVFEVLCNVAGKNPDDVAAVVVFRKGKPTLVLSTTLLGGLVEAVARGVKVEDVSYPSRKVVWHIPGMYNRNYVEIDLGFNPNPDAWMIRDHEGEPFKAKGKVIVYEEKLLPA